MRFSPATQWEKELAWISPCRTDLWKKWADEKVQVLSCPLVVAPFTGRQPTWVILAEWSGKGGWQQPRRQLTSTELMEACKEGRIQEQGWEQRACFPLLNTALSLVCQFKRGLWLTLCNIQKSPENRLVFTLKALQPLPTLKLKDLFLERTIIIQYNLPLFRMRSERFSDKMLHLSGSRPLISFWSPNFPYLA